MSYCKIKENFKNSLWWIIPAIITAFLVFFDNHYQWRIFTKPVIHSQKGYAWNFSVKKYDFTFLTAILGLIAYSVRQKQKLVAEQVAKSRIEWLKITRDYFSKYMSYCEQTVYCKRKLRKIKKKIRNQKNKSQSNMKSIKYLMITNNIPNKTIESLEEKAKSIEKKKNKKSQKANEYYYKMKCSISPEDQISEEIKNYLDMINRSKVCKEEFDRETERLSKDVQKYFKGEWDKAKTEIRTGVISPKDNKSNCQD